MTMRWNVWDELCIARMTLSSVHNWNRDRDADRGSVSRLDCEDNDRECSHYNNHIYECYCMKKNLFWEFVIAPLP